MLFVGETQGAKQKVSGLRHNYNLKILYTIFLTRCTCYDKLNYGDIMVKIMFVCHGNICRSTMAEFVMKDIVKKNGMENDFIICSSATSTEEIGSDTHWGTKKILDEMGISYTKRQAVQLKKSDYEYYDFIIGMDSANMRNINRIIGYDKDNKIHKLLNFANMDRDVADPWYTRDFKTTYDDVLLGCTRLFDYINSYI